MRTTFPGTRLALLLALGTALPAAAPAQTPTMGGTVYREYDIGMRSFAERPADTARLGMERYRDLRQGVVLPDGRLWYVSADRQRMVELRASRVGQRDQSYGLMAERLGRYRLRLDVSELPHLFSTNAKMLRDSAGGLLELPDVRPDTSLWNQCSYRADSTIPTTCSQLYAGRVGVNTGRTRALLSFTPAASWLVVAEYERTRKNGFKPMGMIMGSSPGHPTREILEPVDHTMSRMRFAPTYARQRLRLQASYEYASFGNARDAVVADNPVLATNTATTGAASGRSALAPDNTAHTFALTGGVDAGASRVTASMSYGVRLQNQAFLPFTINSAIDTSALSRDRASLEGDVRTFVAQVGLQSRLAPRLSLGVRLRHFELDDRTPHYEQHGRVTGDRSLSTAVLEREAYSHARQNASVSLRYRQGGWLAAQLSSEMDVWHREAHVRERETTSEVTPRLLVDLTPLDWATLRAGVSKGWRTGSEYGQVAAAQFSEARKYDMATRERERVDVAADFDLATLGSQLSLPAPAMLNLGLLYGRSRADFTKTYYGVQFDHTDSRGATLDFTPVQRVTLSGGYLFERWNAQAGSRYRAPPATLGNTSYDWISASRENLETWTLGATIIVIPRKLELGFSSDRTFGRTSLDAWNPVSPYPLNGSAVADSFPPMNYVMHPLTAVVRYNLSQTMTVSGRYSYERFGQTDFRTDGLAPATGGSYYLGSDPVAFQARYFTVTFSYRPWIPGRRRAAL